MEKGTKDAKDLELNAISGLIDTYLRWKNAQNPPRGFKKYHPSAAGNCLRLMQYQRFAEEGIMGLEAEAKELKAITVRLFDTGHTMHHRWAAYWEEIGILRGVWTCSNKACFMIDDEGKVKDVNIFDVIKKNKTRKYGNKDLRGILKPKVCICGCKEFDYHEVAVESEELNIYGHADLVLDFSRLDASKFDSIKRKFKLENLPTGIIVGDMKTIKDERFKELKETPSLAYKVQLCVYTNILDCDFGLLIYENKNDSDIKTYRIDKSVDGDWKQIKEQMIKLNSMAEIVDDKGNKKHYLPPPRPYNKESYECRYCDFNKVCTNSSIWNSPKLPELRRKFYGDLLE